MKKLFLALAMTMMVGSVGMAFAAELNGNDEDNASGNTLVEYELEGSYTITIPDAVDLVEGSSTEMVIGASDVYIPYTKILTVTVESTNGWYIAARSYGESDRYAYTLSSGDTVIANNGTVLEVYAGNTEGAENTFDLELTEKVRTAGTYQDNLTFTSELVDNRAFLPM